MRTFWPRSPAPGNIGDILTPWMMRQDGVEPTHVSQNESGKILGIGSILRFAKPGDQVWTSGIMRKGDPINPKACFCALRGPLSLEKAKASHRAKIPLGDGALCLPRYYNPAVNPIYPLGVVPHYIDLPHRHEWPVYWQDALLISPLTKDVESFVDLIVSCERIESSSLHGCIIAEAYGIPWTWVKVGSRLSGDDSKVHDVKGSLPHVVLDGLMDARPWIA